ncbi:MAG TPA: gamma-glutamyltransferase [Polyangia bacterium]
MAVFWLALAPSSAFAAIAASVSGPFLHASHAAVASDSRAASAAGVEMLKAGGNAVDAACAATLALGVVNPFASGLGGGGFALIYLAKTGKTTVLDFRETAPAALAGRLKDGVGLTPQSGLSVGVPGEASGLAELARRFGALPFSRCVEPALQLSRGFAVSPWLAQQIRDEIERNPTSGPDLIAKIFSVDRQIATRLRAGDRVARPALAATLERLQREGPASLYTGDTAAAIVDAVAAAGGVLAAADLAAFVPIERQPLAVDFLHRRVLTVPPPSAGGTIIVEALGILAHRVTAWKREAGPNAPDYLHDLAEALKHGFADRARFLGDPAFSRLPLAHLLDARYHLELAQRIRPDRVLAHDAYGTQMKFPTEPARDGGTAHVSVVDKTGNAVALTSTINLEFGARIVAGGIVLNDQMDDFTTATEPCGEPPSFARRVPSGEGLARPSAARGRQGGWQVPRAEQTLPGFPCQTSVFALTGSQANRPAPGKRPVSSMSPTIVLGDRGVELVTGAAGGPRIVSATLQILIDVLVFGLDARRAVATPRIHHQWEPDILNYEPGLPAEAVKALENKGQRPTSRPDIGKANAIVRSRSGLDAAADPRSGGEAAGY